MARKQGGTCPVCGEPLSNGEELAVHHKKPISEGGTDNYSNLQLLHLYCHQQIHFIRKRRKALRKCLKHEDSGIAEVSDLLEPSAVQTASLVLR